MSNLEAEPQELICESFAWAHQPLPERHPPVEILTPRDVPLGGPRAMLVRRTLPQRNRSMIGAWCFLGGNARAAAPTYRAPDCQLAVLRRY